jgi:hypothetical protein
MVEHTITGLRTKRADLFNTAARLLDRLAEIKSQKIASGRVPDNIRKTRDFFRAAMPSTALRQARDFHKLLQLNAKCGYIE